MNKKIFFLLVLFILSISGILICIKYSHLIPTSYFTSSSLPNSEITFSSFSDSEIIKLRKQTPVTEIRVFKSERKLELLSESHIIRAYPVRLGFAPIGHKKQEGDGKTPEGRYSIDWRNPKSAFYKSLHISYPNSQDIAQAKQRGVSPGANIMIHGSTTSKISKLPEMMNYLPRGDWTLGCIAVRNIDIDEIWKLVDDKTPIIIYP
ncbi:L,D-transpeptidase family protein [Acinetobacter stercoris]|uniref:L,D-transpeptidase catalytic domain n=1 Tax=Acinetobacter stercoris TaxID=2126983 RepID=A0A2U3N019_9GAMM|nr:L,D-transpeptidase family protein [Acinetobacter stercoris]SPL71021.1 L,D-transpeptidase catalytic domain [Acinetobacter stercoris]